MKDVAKPDIERRLRAGEKYSNIMERSSRMQRKKYRWAGCEEKFRAR